MSIFFCLNLQAFKSWTSLYLSSRAFELSNQLSFWYLSFFELTVVSMNKVPIFTSFKFLLLSKNPISNSFLTIICQAFVGLQRLLYLIILCNHIKRILSLCLTFGRLGWFLSSSRVNLNFMFLEQFKILRLINC